MLGLSCNKAHVNTVNLLSVFTAVLLLGEPDRDLDGIVTQGAQLRDDSGGLGGLNVKVRLRL